MIYIYISFVVIGDEYKTFQELHVVANVQDLPSDPEILPDVAGCSTTQSDSGNISHSDPEFLPDGSYHPIRNSRIPYFGTNVHM